MIQGKKDADRSKLGPQGIHSLAEAYRQPVLRTKERPMQCALAAQEG